MAGKENTIGKYAAENGNAAAIKEIQSLAWHWRKHHVTTQEVLLAPYKNHTVGVVKHSTYKT